MKKATSIDIGYRRRAEAALRARESEFCLILDAIPTVAWSAQPDGFADFFNQQYLAYVGLPLEQLQGSGWTVAVHPDDRQDLAATWHLMISSGKPGEAEARLRRCDGEYRWFQFRANPMRDGSGSIIKWLGISTDIEDQKRAQAGLTAQIGGHPGVIENATQSKVAEQALDRARSELAHVARATTLNALTASIAHEINQPLSGIITNASTCLRMLHGDPPNIDGARETARRTIRDGNRASDVITRLRTLFSNKEFALEPLDLNKATREVIALSSSDLQRNRVILRSELAENLPLVIGDRVPLQQVILNLVRNASDAMLGVDDRPRQLLIRTRREADDRVRLSVQDVGTGVNPQDLEKVFEAFYTTKSSGMGIGLFVSRSIIERHHGRLWAESNNGPGAIFSFSIPCGSKARTRLV